jgi:excisionase family DNA binding protein
MTRHEPEEETAGGGNVWLNADQATTYLVLPSSRALYQAVRRGEVPAYRWGRRFRFRRQDLDGLLLRGRVLTLSDERLSSGDDAHLPVQKGG